MGRGKDQFVDGGMRKRESKEIKSGHGGKEKKTFVVQSHLRKYCTEKIKLKLRHS